MKFLLGKYKIFLTYIHSERLTVYDQKKSKLDPRNTAGTFVGYYFHSPVHLVYFSETRKINRVRCVTFLDKHT